MNRMTNDVFVEAAATFLRLGLNRDVAKVSQELEDQAGRRTRNVRDKVLMVRSQGDDVPENHMVLLGAKREGDVYSATIGLSYPHLNTTIPLTKISYQDEA